MLQACRELYLSMKAFGTQRVSELGVQNLERDLTFVLEVLGEEDGGHPPTAQLALESVAGECCLEAGEEIAQSRSLWRRVSKASVWRDFRRWAVQLASESGIEPWSCVHSLQNLLLRPAMDWLPASQPIVVFPQVGALFRSAFICTYSIRVWIMQPRIGSSSHRPRGDQLGELLQIEFA